MIENEILNTIKDDCAPLAMAFMFFSPNIVVSVELEL